MAKDKPEIDPRYANLTEQSLRQATCGRVGCNGVCARAVTYENFQMGACLECETAFVMLTRKQYDESLSLERKHRDELEDFLRGK